MPITALPEAPSRSDSPEDFNAKVDALLAALPTFITETNASAAAYGVTLWVSGTTYVVGDRVWSPTDYQTYRRKTNGAGTTDPSADSTNWASITSITSLMLAASAVGPGTVMLNGSIVHSRAGNAETIAIKTRAGSDPTVYDPVLVVFRNATAATGDYSVITLTAATSITISSGSTMGFSNSVAGRLWIVGFNDGGTFRLGVINCRSGTNIYPLSGWGIASSTAEGGAGAADNAHVFYTGTAVSSKPYRVLAYSAWESGLATAGTWGTAPTRTQLFGPGVPLPGTVVQRQRVASAAVLTGTNATPVPDDDTIPQSNEGDAYSAFDVTITPTSAANVLNDKASLVHAQNSSSVTALSLFQDSQTDALASVQEHNASSNSTTQTIIEYESVAGTTSSLTRKLRFGGTTTTGVTINGYSSGRKYGGAMASYHRVVEVMA